MSIYNFSGVTPSGKEVSFTEYEGKVVLIANTASKCGLTPQYGDLQKLYEQYRDQGLVVLGFPATNLRVRSRVQVKRQKNSVRLIMALHFLCLPKWM